MTHDVFSSKYAMQEKVKVDAEYDDTGAEVSRTETEIDILDYFKHIYVKEVVREPRIHYQRVPRLGSYMAIPLIYKNCLHIESLEDAVKDYLDVEKRKADQEIEKQEFNAKQEQDREAAES